MSGSIEALAYGGIGIRWYAMMRVNGLYGSNLRTACTGE